jgi:hypothetical protein
MSIVAARPKTGLVPQVALERSSDQEVYAELVALCGEHPALPIEAGPGGRYTEKREAAEHAFQQKLMDAELLGSGIPEFGNGREVIEPSLWELLEIQYFYFDEARSEGRKYEKVEFFEISAIPLNIRLIPEWLDGELGARGYVEFRHDRDYRHVSLRGIDYTLSDLHSKIVKLLHQAFLRGEEWQHGVKVLGEAGSRQFKMGDVLKSRDDWQSLIESDGKGMYRLKIRLDETAS